MHSQNAYFQRQMPPTQQQKETYNSLKARKDAGRRENDHKGLAENGEFDANGNVVSYRSALLIWFLSSISTTPPMHADITVVFLESFTEINLFSNLFLNLL